MCYRSRGRRELSEQLVTALSTVAKDDGTHPADKLDEAMPTLQAVRMDQKCGSRMLKHVVILSSVYVLALTMLNASRDPLAQTL